MRKRKTTSDSIGRSEEGLLDQGGAQTEPPAIGHTTVAEIDPTGQPVRGRVLVSHKGPELATCTETEPPVITTTCQVDQSGSEASSLEGVAGQVSPTKGPVGQVEELPAPVAEDDSPAARWFWDLLRNAGYEVW